MELGGDGPGARLGLLWALWLFGSREEEFAQNEFDAVEQSVPQKWVLQPGQQQLSAS